MSYAGEERVPSEASMVLLGRPEHLRGLHGRADLPAHFLTVFSGGLFDTVSPEAHAGEDLGQLATLWQRYQVVGLDIGLLSLRRGSTKREQLFHDNLAQKLATRRVVLLAVLQDVEVAEGVSKLSLLREGQVAGPAVVCRPAEQTLGDLLRAIEGDGVIAKVEVDKERGAARLRLRCKKKQRALSRAVCSGVCDLSDLLGFERDKDALVSRWFAADFASPKTALVELLQNCAERQEHAMLEEVVTTWLATRDGMQADTRAFTKFELVVVATRDFTVEDRALLDRFAERNRVWLMTDRLRVGGDKRKLVRAAFVWPDAVASLLARLSLADPRESRGGYFGWRSYVFGASADEEHVERLREQETTRLLNEVDRSDELPHIETAGPYEPVGEELVQARDEVTQAVVDWDEGGVAARAAATLQENAWCSDHRIAGDDLGEVRSQRGEAWEDARLPVEQRDPERAFAQAYWTEIHRRPSVLRQFAAGRHMRGETDLVGHVRDQAHAWHVLLEQRRRLARERESLLQQAEEIDRAFTYHLGAVPRLAIGAVVGAFLGFLCLNVIRVLVLISPTTWFTGALMFFLALLGGFAGALIPAWVERRRGQAATAKLARRLRDVDDAHAQAVADTYRLFAKAENVRQSLRGDGVRKRTVLLAERAWSIVKAAREEVAREFQQRKLLGVASGHRNEHDGLAREDRREWREAARIRPAKRLELRTSGEEWNRAFEGVMTRFLGEWKSDLIKEDPFCTGFFRAAVLRQLVVRLSDYVVAEVDTELLRQLSEQIGDELDLEDWVAPFESSIGGSVFDGALMSTLYEGGIDHVDGGSYVWMHRDRPFAADLLQKLLHSCETVFGSAHIISKSVPGSLPLGGFALLFHELEVHWGDGATLRAGPAPDSNMSDPAEEASS